MHRLVIVGMAVFLSVAGCATPQGSPSRPPSSPAAPMPAAPPTLPAPAASAVPPASTSEPDMSNPGRPSTPVPPPASAAAAAAPAKPKTPDSRPARQTAAAVGVSPAAAASAAPAGKPPPAAPTMSLADLIQRLRDTRAIGVFTKLSLKNQVDDLLGAFRDLYKGPNKQPPAELRQRYDQLLVKVLGLLQQGDPPLAQAIASSREAIWSILADPDKFGKI